ncbi:MAG: insulinase family protein, partial [Thalassolituus sp.]
AENMLRTLIAPGVETDTTDPWYDTAIRIRPMTFAAVDITDSNLHLPVENPFIPENLEVNPAKKSDVPQLITSSENSQLWYYPEHEFQLPKAQVFIHLKKAKVMTDARQRVLAKLYARTVNEALNTYSYPASLAGLNYRLAATDQGLEVAVGGYYDKLPVLLQRIFDEMGSIEISEEEFSRYRSSLQRALENNLKARPFQRTMAEMKNWLIDPSFSDTDLLPLVSDVTLAELSEFADNLKQDLATVTYVHGTLSSEQADHIGNLTQQYFPASASLPDPSLLVKAPVGKFQKIVEQDHPDKVMTLYFQGEDSSDTARAEAGLLAQMIASPYYQYMRTDQQLGYIVFAMAYPIKAMPGLVFIVQSPTASPEEMIKHSDIFFRQYEATLSTMDDEEFGLFRQGLITRLLEAPKNMSEKSGVFWSDLSSGRYSFDTRESIASEVEKLEKTRVLNLYREAVLNGGWSQLLYAKGDAAEGYTDIDDIDRGSLPRIAEPQYPLPEELSSTSVR